MGNTAANISPQITTSTRARIKLFTAPSSKRAAVLTVIPKIKADVRRLNSPRIFGADIPPIICEPAAMAAASPATL